MDEPGTPLTRRPLLGTRHHAWLALGFAAFVVYGSLVPFAFRPLPLWEAVARFREACSRPVRVDSKSDFVANALLGVPVAYFLTGALCVDRARRARWRAVLVPPVCVTLAAAVEFAQLYYPPRVCSLSDIVAQAAGALAGVAAWLAVGQRVADGCRAAWGPGWAHGGAVRLLPGYLLALALVQVLPLDLTLSPADLYRKYRAGAVRLVPFTRWRTDPAGALEHDLWQMVYLFPLGVLAAHFPGAAWRRWRGWARVAGCGAAAAGVMLFLKLFVVSRSCDTTDVFTGALAALAGWAVTLAGRGAPARRAVWGRLRAPLVVAWLAAAVFLNWRPFDFFGDLDRAWHRLAELSWVPFADYEQGSALNALDQFIHKTLLFLLLGVLLTPARPAGRGGAAWPVVLVAAVVAVGLEAGQLFLPTRYPSLTDVLVESCGAWLGVLLVRASASWGGAPGGAGIRENRPEDRRLPTVAR